MRDYSVSPFKNRVESGFRELVMEITVWITLFRMIIQELGRDHLREALTRHGDEARLGFVGFTLHLRDKGALPADLAEKYDAFLPHFWDFREDPAANDPEAVVANGRRVSADLSGLNGFTP
jgi:hypothetical protein